MQHVIGFSLFSFFIGVKSGSSSFEFHFSLFHIIVLYILFLNVVRFNRILQILQFRFHTKNILAILPIRIEIEFFLETCSYNMTVYNFIFKWSQICVLCIYCFLPYV